MSKFNSFIEKVNFKKIFIVYVIAALVCGVACVGAVGYVFRDKINLAVQYQKASNALKKQTSDDSIKQAVDTLADSTADICDILLLDQKNNIVYSAKNSSFAEYGNFTLSRADNGKFLQSNNDPDTAFRFVKKDEFMLSAVFADDFTKIHDEYDENSFYLDNFQNKHLYMISLIGRKDSASKAYVISDPKPVAYGILSLKITACIFMFLFMLYMIIVALWVYQNARKSRLSAPIWGIITLFTNLAGVLVYLIYKHINSVCAFCGTVQSRGNTFCTECGKKLGSTCTECGCSIKPHENYCPKCGHKLD